MDDEHTSFVSGRLRKYGGLFAALTAVMNLSLGGFLMYAWITTMANHVCNRQVPLWVLVSGCTSLVYGGLFALYALYALVTFIRQRGYEELETSPVSCFRSQSFLCFSCSPSLFVDAVGSCETVGILPADGHCAGARVSVSIVVAHLWNGGGGAGERAAVQPLPASIGVRVYGAAVGADWGLLCAGNWDVLHSYLLRGAPHKGLK
jgi:hypothetical protein